MACRWDEFFAACDGCHFDFLATHLYSCNPQVLQWYLLECKKYNLPIWLTEFSCPNGARGPPQRQEAFMTAALHILSTNSEVDRYAWFAPRTSGDWLGETASLLQPSKAELSSLGKVYMQDKHHGHSNVWPLPVDLTPWTNMCSHCYSMTHQHDVLTPCEDCGFQYVPKASNHSFLIEPGMS